MTEGSTVKLTLIADPGEYRLGRYDITQGKVVAVSRNTRRMRLGDSWYVGPDSVTDLIVIAAFSVPMTPDGRELADHLTWQLVPAAAVIIERRQ